MIWLLWWFLLVLMMVSASYVSSDELNYTNTTFSSNNEDDLESDPYLVETGRHCSAGWLSSCVQKSALTSFGRLLRRPEFRLTDTARLVQETGREGSSSPRSVQPESLLGWVSSATEDWLQRTGLEMNLTPEVTDGGRLQPRFIDEIYSELDTVHLKHTKPQQQYELKKLFIPLLVILKVFKLKLLLLLPLILGLASFKKLVAVAVILIPAVIAYFKVCKPDLGHGYGSYGHSSFYHAPPSTQHKYTEDGSAYGNHRVSYGGVASPATPFGYGHNMAYRAHNRR